MSDLRGSRLPPLLELRKQFGQHLRQLRHSKKLSQEELAFQAGIDRTYISSVEQGRRNISLDNIGRLAKALGLKLHEMMPTEDDSTT